MHGDPGGPSQVRCLGVDRLCDTDILASSGPGLIEAASTVHLPHSPFRLPRLSTDEMQGCCSPVAGRSTVRHL